MQQRLGCIGIIICGPLQQLLDAVLLLNQLGLLLILLLELVGRKHVLQRLLLVGCRPTLAREKLLLL